MWIDHVTGVKGGLARGVPVTVPGEEKDLAARGVVREAVEPAVCLHTLVRDLDSVIVDVKASCYRIGWPAHGIGRRDEEESAPFTGHGARDSKAHCSGTKGTNGYN